MSRTSFVGRLAEMTTLRASAASSGLVTVTGPGGCGKSRLVAEAFEDEPIVFADLTAAVTNPSLVLLRTIQRDAAPGERVIDACTRHLRQRPAVLVVLDNCEHLIDEAAELASVLTTGRLAVRVVATSREPLRVAGERVVALGPLPIETDAVELFHDRARQAGAQPTQRHEVVTLCKLLDGLPLAIEIAAARTPALPVAQLLEEWSAWPRLLAGRRTRDRRHLSVLSCIEWSTRLLTEEEFRVLRGASVFRAPFRLGAARSVLGEDAVVAVPALVEKSLLQIDGSGPNVRYRMLDLVRDFASRALSARPDEEHRVRHAHLQLLCGAARDREPDFSTSRIFDAIRYFRSVLPDVRAAVEWATRSGFADDACDLVGALWRFWWAGAGTEGAAAVKTALGATGAASGPRAGALIAGVLVASKSFDFETALDLGAAAIATGDLVGDERLSARARCWHGWMLASLQSPDAVDHLSIAERQARSSGDATVLADALNGRAHLAVTNGQPAVALDLVAEVLAITDVTGNEVTGCHARANEAAARLMVGEIAAAEAAAYASLQVAEQLHDEMYTVLLLIVLCRAASLRADTDRVDALAQRALDVAQESGNAVLLAASSIAAALSAWTRRDLAGAADGLDRGLAAYAAVNPAAAAELALLRAEVYEATGRTAPGGEAVASKDTPWVQTRRHLAASRRRGDAEEAHRALNLARLAGDRIAQVDAIELIALGHSHSGRHERAVELAAAAAAERERLGYRLRQSATPTDPVALAVTAIGSRAVSEASARGVGLRFEDAIARAQQNRGRRGRPSSGWSSLTPAERRVAALVAQGLTNAQIAEQLVVSRETVKGHVSAALRKMQVANRAALVATVTAQTAD